MISILKYLITNSTFSYLILLLPFMAGEGRPMMEAEKLRLRESRHRGQVFEPLGFEQVAVIAKPRYSHLSPHPLHLARTPPSCAPHALRLARNP